VLVGVRVGAGLDVLVGASATAVPLQPCGVAVGIQPTGVLVKASPPFSNIMFSCVRKLAITWVLTCSNTKVGFAVGKNSCVAKTWKAFRVLTTWVFWLESDSSVALIAVAVAMLSQRDKAGLRGGNFVGLVLGNRGLAGDIGCHLRRQHHLVGFHCHALFG
jgi:hypothetical protein